VYGQSEYGEDVRGGEGVDYKPQRDRYVAQIYITFGLSNVFPCLCTDKSEVKVV
jgi:hypothetical protein